VSTPGRTSVPLSSAGALWTESTVGGSPLAFELRQPEDARPTIASSERDARDRDGAAFRKALDVYRFFAAPSTFAGLSAPLVHGADVELWWSVTEGADRDRVAQSLADRVRDPGFTPGLRHLSALVGLLTDEQAGKYAERAIGRIGPAALDPIGRLVTQADPPLRSALVKVVGRLATRAGDEQACVVLLRALEDPDPKSRRNAAIALGHLKETGVEAALVRAWQRDPRPEMRRSLAASLGKVGGPEAMGLLRSAIPSSDPELSRIAQKALMMAERTESRSEEASIDLSRPCPSPTEVIVSVRRGLEDLLGEELSRCRGLSALRPSRPGQLRATLESSPAALYQSRTMLGFRFPLRAVQVARGETIAQAVVRGLETEQAQTLFARWTVGRARYRIAWVDGAHRRSTTWNAAALVSQRLPHLVNDPSRSNWEVLVGEKSGWVDIALRPNAADPRFTWRVGTVAASSHPTIAAALARVAGVREDDVVWDPFVGSGSELIERALLGPCRRLQGSDVDRNALELARGNLVAAGVGADLTVGDALETCPHGVTLILTNPPMGRRVSRGPDFARVLEHFLRHAARVLVPQGRLVWIAPHPKGARAVGAGCGLALEWASQVDMGGFEAELQRWVKS
jgi:23S rRNA G2445 N2-methylase RlmL